MTATTVNSDNVSNIIASPIVPLHDRDGQLNVLIDSEAILTTSTDEVGDKVLFGLIPSNAKILDIRVMGGALDVHATPTLDLDIGLAYSGIGSQQKEDGRVLGDVIDVNCFAADSAIGTAAYTDWTNVRTDKVASLDMEAWQVGGLSADPGGLFAISFTVGTNAAATGVASVAYCVRVDYI